MCQKTNNHVSLQKMTTFYSTVEYLKGQIKLKMLSLSLKKNASLGLFDAVISGQIAVLGQFGSWKNWVRRAVVLFTVPREKEDIEVFKQHSPANQSSIPTVVTMWVVSRWMGRLLRNNAR